MKLKKNLFLLLLILIVSAFVLVACGGQSDEGASSTDNASEETDTEEETEAPETMDPVTLSFADFFPAPHPAQEQLFTGWADAVNEATDGLVTIEMYPGESLLSSGDIYPGVESGVADIGHDVSGYNAGRLPVLNSMYLGGVEYDNVAVSSHVARDLIEELKPAELEDTEVMIIYGISPGLIMSTKPVETLEDLAGMQIRASGRNVETLEALGATPVAMTVTEAYEGMQRGVVDGILLPADTLQGFNLAEVTDYVTHTNFIYNTVHYVTMNKDVWNSFPAHIQEAIKEVNAETFEKTVDLFTRLVEGGLEYAINEHGVEEIFLSDEEADRWREKLTHLVDDHVEELNSEGLDGREVMDKIIELADKYNSELGN